MTLLIVFHLKIRGFQGPAFLSEPSRSWGRISAQVGNENGKPDLEWKT